jgi:hypothetical protein
MGQDGLRELRKEHRVKLADFNLIFWLSRLKGKKDWVCASQLSSFPACKLPVHSGGITEHGAECIA